MISNTRRWIVLAALMSMALSACNFNTEPPTPTVSVPQTATQETATPSPSPDVTQTPSLTPSPLPTVERIVLTTSTPSAPDAPTTEPATPTMTPGPYEVTIAAGDTMSRILPRFGYLDFSVLPAVREINPDIDVDNLQVGRTLRIPIMTYTPSPPGYEATVSMLATLGIRPPEELAANTQLTCHRVIEGENIITIAETYNTTIQILSRLNPEIPFTGCDFDNRSGGETCNPPIGIGQCVEVPLPTATPTLSPTPSGSETPTQTPTFAAPLIISPPDGVTVNGPITMQWVSVGILGVDEYYYVEVTDTTLNTQFRQVTKDTSMLLPTALIPTDGQPHTIAWVITVVQRNAGGGYALIGGVMPVRTFIWQSR